jgi:cell division protein FtsB
MREFEKKRRLKKTIYSKFTSIILLAILLFLISGTFHIYQKARQSEQKLEMAENKLDDLQQRHNQLTDQIEEIKSDVGQEEQLRSKFYLAKEGEKAVFIIDQEPEPEPEPESGIFGTAWKKFISIFD